MNKEITIDLRNLFITFVLFLGILPAIELAGFTVPMQYLLIPVFLFVVFLSFLKYYKIPGNSKVFMYLWLLIIFGVFFTSIFSPLLIEGRFDFPTEAIQYIARFLFFATFIIIFYNSNINLKSFMRIFIIVMSLGMMVAVIQYLNVPGSSLFQRMYSFSAKHLDFMAREDASRRASGVAHFATSNGGIAAFTFILVVSFYLFYKRYYWLTFVGVGLAIFNVVASQARMGYLTVAFAIIVFYFVYNRVKKKRIKSTIYVTIIVGAIAGVLYWLYSRGNAIVLYAIRRWETLKKQVDSGGNRIGQVNEALSRFSHPWDFLFGKSRSVDTMYIEVEPMNILYLYGGVGFVLQYGLIFLLLVYFYKNMKRFKHEPILLTLLAASFISLLSYQFFSLAYYFFREIYIGLFPWILMGATIGAVEKYKRMKELDPDYQLESPEDRRKRKRKRYRITW